MDETTKPIPLHDLAFFIAIFFLCGVLISSISGSIALRLVLSGGAAVLVMVIALAFRQSVIAMLAAAIFLGGLYHVGYEEMQTREEIIFDAPVTIEGIVRRAAPSASSQKVDVGNIRLTLARYPSYRYGNVLRVEGVIKAPDAAFRNRYLRDGIVGTMNYPITTLVNEDGGSFFMAALIHFKERIARTFTATLPRGEALLMSGLTLGTKAEFSKEFRAELSQSGTAHLVALSGYNIMVIVLGLGWLFRRMRLTRAAFPLTVGAIVAFVLMTGAEASVVRAAFMGSIVMLAGAVGRIYSFRNAIALAAFFMALQNPKVLLFDIGFALSFAALLGIVYLEPIIGRITRLDARGGILGWRKSISMTVAATIATLPITLVNFGTFSLSGIIANIAMLLAVPATMFLGLLIAIGGFIAMPLAKLFALLAYPLLWYEGAMISFFSGFGYVSGITGAGAGFLIAYYSVLIALMLYVNRRLQYVELFETQHK
ncbi:MAG: ComEC/Rec2 family competence protein [bacterium]|nr:ComEC/Rec2 family competence protein [bacterium]